MISYTPIVLKRFSARLVASKYPAPAYSVKYTEFFYDDRLKRKTIRNVVKIAKMTPLTFK